MWRRPDGRALVATVDVFTPIVDDAATWGRIAAVNAASDVYAMGGTPLFALAVAVWPRDDLPLALLSDVLGGGQQAAADNGWVVAGGHTIDGPEPLYGQAVIGEVPADRLLTNTAARPGDAIVITKPIGTGLLATAVKRRESRATAPGGALVETYARAVAEMTRTNADASQLALDMGVNAATDVTGFGLLGHLRQMALASGCAAEVAARAVPRLPGLDALLAAGEVPGGTVRNLAHVRPHLNSSGVTEDDLVVLADAQTSGGLLLAAPAGTATAMVVRLRQSGHDAATVGRFVDGEAGHLDVHP